MTEETKEYSFMEIKVQRAQKLSESLMKLVVKDSEKMKGYGATDKHSIKILAVSGVLSALIAQCSIISDEFMESILGATIGALQSDVNALMGKD